MVSLSCDWWCVVTDKRARVNLLLAIGWCVHTRVRKETRQAIGVGLPGRDKFREVGRVGLWSLGDSPAVCA
jgi:hypothetical protein